MSAMLRRNTETPLITPEGDPSKQLIQKGRDYFVPNYRPREMILDHGKGSMLWDLDGYDYVDLGSGIAVNGLGHQDPDLLAALDTQSRKLWHTSNVFFTEPAIHLAEELVRVVPWAKRVYFCNSGTEATEAVIKLVRKWAADQGRDPEHREIITFAGSFHGRTLAAVTATAQPKYQQGFEPLPGGFVYCPKFNDIEALRPLVTEKTCAILLETVQGEGGIIPAAPGFLKAVRQLCDEKNVLFVADEIQSGMGRTGYLFAHFEDEVAPDVMPIAKALGCGLPIGAMVVGEKAENTLGFGTHGSTFGGNPVMCAVAYAALKKINTPQLMANVMARSRQLFDGLHAIHSRLDLFREVRGRGLMVGAVLKDPWLGKSNDLADIARRFGVLALVAGPDVLRFLPPLTITEDELALGLERLEAALAYAVAHAQG
jgi:acetylornithine/N-succinyldiaminopimelate aminotransferase